MILTLAGVRATSAQIRVPQVGAWVADVVFDSAASLPEGKIPLAVGAATFVGTVDPRFSGTFAGRRLVRVVAGANGWASTVVARHFHNDALLKDRTVIQATADECGETLAFDAAPVAIGADYIRRREAGSAALNRLATQGWYVDYTGVTHVGPRTIAPLGKFELLDFDAGQNLATLGTTEAQAVGIGATLTDRLDKPLTVRDILIAVSADGARVVVWGTT